MNAVSAKSPDPSMEEILASIRRIIADEGEGRDASAASSNKAAARPAPLPPEDDVLDLADLPDARRPEAEPIRLHDGPPVPPAQDESSASLELEDADLTFADPAPAPSEPASPRAASPEPAAPRAEAPPQGPAPDEGLVSQQTTASVSQAFNLLSHTVLARHGQTLEDLVTAMLKPMLREWLDDNLPPMVERLVRAEIERVARGSR